MALGHSPRIVTDGLVLALDAANRKSYIGAVTTSLINTDSWTVSSGTVSGYNCNGGTNENVRSYDTDPWGNQSLVWGTFADGSGGADGGWNTDYPGIDPTKLYRFSVWVRRTSSTGAGTFYYGTGAGGAEVMGTSDSATKGNPYWECTGTGNLTQNQWYLCCGHVYPHFTTYTGRHPNTGYFTVAGGTTKVMDVNGCNIGSDLKWNPASSSAVHRTYHYYCGDATTRLQFLSPRMDVCDGREPSILELLTNGISVWKDLCGTSTKGALINALTYTPTNSGSLVFNGSNNYIDLGSDILLKNSGGWAVESWVNLPTVNGASLYNFIGSTNYVYNCWYWTILNSKLAVWDITQGVWKYGSTTILANTWYQCVLVVNDAGTGYQFYLNGIAEGGDHVGFSWTSSKAALSIGYIGRGNAAEGRYFGGKYPVFRAYNRALTATEVKQNFNALRGRYGV